jgi:hypothetical protein
MIMIISVNTENFSYNSPQSPIYPEFEAHERHP